MMKFLRRATATLPCSRRGFLRLLIASIGLSVVLGSHLPNAAAQAPRFRIVNINNGDILSGDVTIVVATSDRSIQAGDVWLAVDEQDITSGNIDPARPISDTEQRIEFVLETDGYSNGARTLEISDGTLTETRAVTFDNALSNISNDTVIDEDPVEGDTARFTATLFGDQPWSVSIQDDDGVTLRTYTGQGSIIDATWDGKDELGQFVPDDSYVAVLTATGNQGTRQARRRVNKASFGGCFVLLQKDVFPSGLAEYKKFLRQKLETRNGVHWAKVHILVVSASDVNRDARLRDRINRQLQLPMKLFYVEAHGGEHPHPFFGIGAYTWYSNDPGGQGHGGGRPGNPSRGNATFNFNVRAWYAEQGFDGPKLAWISHCKSLGSDGQGGPKKDIFGNLVSDFSWAEAFNVFSYIDSVMLGWNGDCQQYGSLAPPDNTWDQWRRNIWVNLFDQNRNFQTSFIRTNNLTPRRFLAGQNPQDRADWCGDGFMSF